MTDSPPPPPPPPGGFQLPPQPPPGYQPPPQYQQQGYGWTQGGGAVEYAGFWMRFLAALIDGLILGVPMGLLGYLADPDAYEASVGIGYNPSVAGWVNLVSTVVGVLYYGFLEGGASGQTIGKRACSIRVVDADTGQPPIGVGRAIGRYFARILSGIVLLLGYLWMLWDPKKQTWHDKIVRSLVVKA